MTYLFNTPSLNPHARFKASALLVVLALMLIIFTWSLSALNLDRVQEDVYLGRPYLYVAQGHWTIDSEDPFQEMGPHAVYPPAALLYYTGSLAAVRFFQFSYSLIVMALLMILFFRQPFARTLTRYEIAGVSLIMLAVWLSMPLALIYPAQVNGMTAGFACVLLGLLLLETHPALSMLSFGFAYTFKGQFLAMLPGLLLYPFICNSSESVWSRVRQALSALAFFFLPCCVLVPLLSLGGGMIDDRRTLWEFSASGPLLLFNQTVSALAKLAGHREAVGEETLRLAAFRRQLEYSGFGPLAWGQIILSAFMAWGYLAWAITQRIRRGWKHAIPVNPVLLIFSAMASFYWINYLFFWSYPYWYNVFAVLFFNAFWAVLALGFVYRQCGRVIHPRNQKWLLSLILLLALTVSANRLSRLSVLVTRASGNSLTAYEWMWWYPPRGIH